MEYQVDSDGMAFLNFCLKHGSKMHVNRETDYNDHYGRNASLREMKQSRKKKEKRRKEKRKESPKGPWRIHRKLRNTKTWPGDCPPLLGPH